MKFQLKIKTVLFLIGCFGFGFAGPVFAAPTQLKEVVVTAKPQKGVDFKQDVEGAKIYSGKKTSSTPLEYLPQIQNNNYRQAFSQLSGLLVSEQPNQAHVNINYRGIGDPHESQDILTLEDGLPIGVERYGYSTTYYVPPMEAVERVELVRGGSALLYGPQPGPVLNYVTYAPVSDRALSLSAQHVLGSNDFYSTFNQISGTVDRMGYLGYFHHAEGDGRRLNEQFEVTGGNFKFVLDADEDSRWTLNLNVYEKDSGEPGRLTLAQYNADRMQTPRPSDELRIDRYASSLTYEREVSDDTLWTATVYGAYVDRFSRRRTSNTSNQNNLDRREVYSGGLEGRLRHDYEALGERHTFAGGAMIYGSDAPRTQDRSTTYPSENGTPIFELDYRNKSAAVFGENQFNFGNFSIIPAFRLELVDMRVEEEFNTGKTSQLHDIQEFYAVPLFGIGSKLALGELHELYANASQGFKPPQFDDLAPTGNNTIASTTLEEGRTWTYETGLRGNPFTWAQYDASVFLTEYENYFGTVTVGSGTQRQNVGQAGYDGVDLSGEADLIGLTDALRGSNYGEQLGSFSVYGNVSFLSAAFESGPLTGKEPAYAPNYVVKTGLIYRFLEGRAKLALMGTFVEDHYWADNNLAGSTGLTGIPAYNVWDLTGEVKVAGDFMKIFFGVNNLADKTYFSRVRSDGIEPAAERNYYGGAKFSW